MCVDVSNIAPPPTTHTPPPDSDGPLRRPVVAAKACPGLRFVRETEPNKKKMSGADAAAPAPAPGPTPASPANAAIITKLKDQVGFYFSARNLQQDTFLYSKMDRLLRVPLEVVADFHRVKDLRATQDQLLQAARESSNLIVHEEGGRVLVSPAHIKPALRTTLILREVPEDVTEDEIKALFAEAPVSVKTEVGSNRFVEFATEEQVCCCCWLLFAACCLGCRSFLDRLCLIHE